MAKISARGCTKLAHATKTAPGSDGWERKRHLTLRSDGKVLSKVDIRPAGEKRWNVGSYKIVSKTAWDIHRFRAYCDANGYVLDNR